MRHPLWLLALAWLLPASLAVAQPVPSEIVVGTLHAGSGTYASISTPVFDGLKIWVDQTNAAGGAFVKPFKPEAADPPGRV